MNATPEENKVPNEVIPTENASASTPEAQTDAATVESLENRPKEPARLNEMTQLAVGLGVTTDQFDKTTSDYGRAFSKSVNLALSSKLGDLSIAELESSLEKNSKVKKYYLDLFKKHFLVPFNVKFWSPTELKSFKKSVKGASSISAILAAVNAFPANSRYKDDVVQLYNNAFSLLLYGQGGMQADVIVKFLRKIELSNEAGESKKLSELLGTVLDAPGCDFTDQNINPAEAVSAKVTMDLVVMAQDEPKVDLAKIIKRMSDARPVVANVEDRHVQEASTFLTAFKSSAVPKVLKYKQDQSLNRSREAKKAELTAKKAEIEARHSENEVSIRTARSEWDLLRDELDQATEDLESHKLTMNSPATPDERAELQRLNSSRLRIKSQEERRAKRYNELVETSKNDTILARINTELLEIEKDQQRYEDSFNTVRIEFRTEVETLMSYISSRVVNQEKGGVKIDLSQFKLLTQLKGILDNQTLGVEERDAQLVDFTHTNSIDLDIELSKLKMMFGNVRNYTQQEYCLGVLTEFYKEKFGYTEGTAKLMASSQYVRMQKEHRLEKFRSDLLSKRAETSMSGVEKLSADHLIKLVARERMVQQNVKNRNIAGTRRFDDNEIRGLEAISFEMNLEQLRDHASKASISIDGLTHMLYNLTSFFVPRRLADGTMAALADSKEIAKINTLTDTIVKLLSEHAALKVMTHAKQISNVSPEVAGVQALAKGLNSYMNEFDLREQSIVTAAKGSCSNITSRKQLKARRNEILKQANIEGWNNTRLKQELETAGINGLQDGTILTLRTLDRMYNPIDKHIVQNAKKLGLKTLDVAKNTALWVRDNKIKAITSPIWIAPYAGYKLLSDGADLTKLALKSVKEKVNSALGYGLDAVSLTGRTGLGILGLPILGWHTAKEVFQATKDQGQKVKDIVSARVRQTINGE